jgi:hypothetical protein
VLGIDLDILLRTDEKWAGADAPLVEQTPIFLRAFFNP